MIDGIDQFRHRLFLLRLATTTNLRRKALNNKDLRRKALNNKTFIVTSVEVTQILAISPLTRHSRNARFCRLPSVVRSSRNDQIITLVKTLCNNSLATSKSKKQFEVTIHCTRGKQGSGRSKDNAPRQTGQYIQGEKTIRGSSIAVRWIIIVPRIGGMVPT